MSDTDRTLKTAFPRRLMLSARSHDFDIFFSPTATRSLVLVPLHHMVIGQRDSPAIDSRHHDITGLSMQLQHGHDRHLVDTG